MHVGAIWRKRWINLCGGCDSALCCHYCSKVLTFYPRDAMLAVVLAMVLCLSVTSRCSVEVVGRIELVFGMEASFDQSYTVF